MGKAKSKKTPALSKGMIYELTCVCCPVGCRLTGIFTPEEKDKISEHTCLIGWSYSVQEQRMRERIVTALIPVREGKAPLRVRTSKPVRREYLFQLLTELSKITASIPVYEGKTIVQNICGLEVNIVAAEEYY